MSKLKLSAQEGRVLILTLIALAVGCLLIPPLLAYISTNLAASRATEEGMKEQYAADAGVEYAIRRIQDADYPAIPFDTPTLVNGMPVTVTVTTEGEWIYKITSKATNDDGSSTRIESYVSLIILDFSWLFDSAITSRGNVTIQPGSVVTGTVRCYEDNLDNSGTIDYWETYPEEDWPTEQQLREFYLGQVDVSTPYPDDIIDVASGTEADPYLIGPLYYVGDLLKIQSSQVNATAVLTGTVYIAGDLEIGKTGKDFTLDLNGQTIYVEGTIYAGTKCTIRGSGCIIAQGDITFLPHIESAPDNFLFLMSTGGESTVQPGDSLYGAVAGSANVQLQPNCVLERTDVPGDGLNFGGSGGVKVHTYNIYP